VLFSTTTSPAPEPQVSHPSLTGTYSYLNTGTLYKTGFGTP